MRYALVNKDGLIVNVIEWDGIAQWSPPEGLQAILCDQENKYDTYDFNTNKFTRHHVIAGDTHSMADMISKLTLE